MIRVERFGPVAPRAEVWTLSGKPGDVNTPEEPDRIRSRRSTLDGAAERFDCEFLPCSYTVLRLRRRE